MSEYECQEEGKEPIVRERIGDRKRQEEKDGCRWL